MVTAPPVTCSRHRRRDSVVRCSTCDAPLCADCIVKTPVGFKCPACVGGRAAPPGAGPDRRRLVIGAAAVVVVALVAFALTRGGSGDGAGEGAAVVTTGERPVEIVGAGGVPIAGTLRIPRAAADGKVPALVILGGFGQTDRNGILSGNGLGDPLYQELAARLAEAGMASYRYDKRGSGESLLPAETPLLFSDMVDDARAAVGFLAQRHEVNPDAIAVIGHGGGGLVALQLAADPRVRRVVLLSTPGRPLVDVVADDFARSNHAGAPEQIRAVVDQLKRDGNLPPMDSLQPDVRRVFAYGGPSWLKGIYSIDAVADARQVAVPTLVVRGERDTGLVAADSDLLAEALGAHTDVIVDPDTDNTLSLPEPVPTGASAEGRAHDIAMGAASASITRDKQLMDRVITWLRDGLGAKPA